MQARLAVARAMARSRPVHLGGTRHLGSRRGADWGENPEFKKTCCMDVTAGIVANKKNPSCEMSSQKAVPQRKVNHAPGTHIPLSQSIVPVFPSMLRPISVWGPMQRARRLQYDSLGDAEANPSNARTVKSATAATKSRNLPNTAKKLRDTLGSHDWSHNPAMAATKSRKHNHGQFPRNTMLSI